MDSPVIILPVTYTSPQHLSFDLDAIRIANFFDWADNFVAFGDFVQFLSTDFGTVSPLSRFSINQPLF